MHILLSNTSKEPLFQQIKEQIKQQIYQEELKEGEALPSIRLLAKQLQVSVITTKRAYEDLEKEGFLVSSVGKGTFVAGQQPHILKERQIQELENDLEQIVEKAQQIGLTKQAFIERIDLFFD
ncbi:GntR family transcriptional regulator [Paraliobacillus salinarum]|uniref:GntR family transcriptional regulator n=1 Tax=Paraliobacillus salinarum TaxID=1158996 RepID=UPI0015F62AB1|nr:GntR family transcriptional regulator [Paraliobacillus salinarum]